MSFLKRLFGREEKSYTSLDLWREVYGSRMSSSGKTVNWQTSLEVTTVLACVRVIANGISQVPFRVYQEDGAGRSVASAHPLNVILSRRPNDWQTSFEFRETMAFHAALTGNFYAFVNRQRGRVIELIPIPPQWVTVEQNADYSLIYKVRPDKGGA